MSRAGELIAKAKASARAKYEAYKYEQREKKEEIEEMEGIKYEAKQKQKEVHKVEYRKAMIHKAQQDGKAQAIKESQAKSGNLIDRLAGSIDKGARMMDFATARPDQKNLPRVALERKNDNEMPNIMRMEQQNKPNRMNMNHPMHDIGRSNSRPMILDQMLFTNRAVKKQHKTANRPTSYIKKGNTFVPVYTQKSRPKRPMKKKNNMMWAVN